jgi:hypothetical protein
MSRDAALKAIAAECDVTDPEALIKWMELLMIQNGHIPVLTEEGKPELVEFVGSTGHYYVPCDRCQADRCIACAHSNTGFEIGLCAGAPKANPNF